VRKQALEDVKEARAHGDLSENFEYKAAKKFKNENESRIRYLEKMIRTAKVISEESAEDEVGMNNTVELYFEEDDETELFIRETLLADAPCLKTNVLFAPPAYPPPPKLRYKADDVVRRGVPT
jgi:hypothetical protein